MLKPQLKIAKNLAPAEVCNPISMPRLIITVSQNITRKSRFDDLCRNSCWANAAPGQPPAKASICKVPSDVRQALRFALDLSKA